MSAEYWIDLYARAEVERDYDDETAAPQQDSAGCRLEPVVTLACTSCQLVYTPDPAAFDRGNTGCPRCGGWTWIAQLITAPREGGEPVL